MHNTCYLPKQSLRGIKPRKWDMHLLEKQGKSVVTATLVMSLPFFCFPNLSWLKSEFESPAVLVGSSSEVKSSHHLFPCNGLYCNNLKQPIPWSLSNPWVMKMLSQSVTHLTLPIAKLAEAEMGFGSNSSGTTESSLLCFYVIPKHIQGKPCPDV